jgi:hypothetical protein
MFFSCLTANKLCINYSLMLRPESHRFCRTARTRIASIVGPANLGSCRSHARLAIQQNLTMDLLLIKHKFAVNSYSGLSVCATLAPNAGRAMNC